MPASLRFCILLIVSFSQFIFAQPNKILSGKVTDGTNSISAALVRIQDLENSTFTDVNGNFQLSIEGDTLSKFIWASKSGFYNGSTKIELNSKDHKIIITPLPNEDNPSYQWVNPTPDPTDNVKNCGDCHKQIYDQWAKSGHAQSASNSKFLDIYNGTDANGDPFYQPGYRLDHPYSKGNCANCHAPTAAIKNTIGVDLNKLDNIEKMGVSCDFCHKVKDIHLKENTSVNTGVMMMELLRPSNEEQICFGPHDDSSKPAAFSPQISKSIFCAPCHQGSFWGLPIYETYSEWLNSDYVEKDIQCQNCHMPSNKATTKIAQTENAVERDPASIHSHSFIGPDNTDFLKSSIKMTTNAIIKGRFLEVEVKIKNIGAGHHIPTGQPMRNMILVVEAVDSKGNNLKYLDEDEVVPYWGGHGDPTEGNYEGLPGKGFAKVLFENYSRYVRLRLGVKWQHVFPAPHWRLTRIKTDNRIPALSTDKSTYSFRISGSKKPFTVKAKLIYRETFKNWAKMKKWDLKDVILAEKVITIQK